MLKRIAIPTDSATLSAEVLMPEDPAGIVVWVHGARANPHRELVSATARKLAEHELASVNLELPTYFDTEERLDEAMERRALHMIAQRLLAVTSWLRASRATATLPIGYFGVGVGGAAACVAAAAQPPDVACLVTWEGRVDLVGRDLLEKLRAPALLLVRDDDAELLADTRLACRHLRQEHRVKLVESSVASGVPEAAEQVARYAQVWFEEYLRGEHAPARTSSAHP
jgi:dienelactone hydrolase